MAYSYEINAATGAILKHETELDDWRDNRKYAAQVYLQDRVIFRSPKKTNHTLGRKYCCCIRQN